LKEEFSTAEDKELIYNLDTKDALSISYPEDNNMSYYLDLAPISRQSISEV